MCHSFASFVEIVMREHNERLALVSACKSLSGDLISEHMRNSIRESNAAVNYNLVTSSLYNGIDNRTTNDYARFHTHTHNWGFT